MKTCANELNLPQSLVKQMESDLPSTLGFIVEGVQNAGKNLGYTVDNIKQHKTEFFLQSSVGKNSLNDAWRLDELNNHDIKFYLGRPLELLGRWSEVMARGRESTPTVYPVGIPSSSDPHIESVYPTQLAEKQEKILKDNFFNLVQMVNNHYQFHDPINGGKYRDITTSQVVLDTVAPKNKAVNSIESLRAKFSIGTKKEPTLKLG